jgi:hypothetical protein
VRVNDVVPVVAPLESAGVTEMETPVVGLTDETVSV